jgi:hypothetical protein
MPIAIDARARCILCGNLTRRKKNPRRPCCRKCEKTAPTAITCPAAFLGSHADKVAKAAMDAVENQQPIIEE